MSDSSPIAIMTDVLAEHKTVLRGFMDEAKQYGMRANIDQAVFRLTLEWTQLRRGVLNFGSVFAAQDEADAVIDAVLKERFRRGREQELIAVLVDEYGAEGVANRVDQGWYEDWEIEAAFKAAQERASIRFEVEGETK